MVVLKELIFNSFLGLWCFIGELIFNTFWEGGGFERTDF